MSRDGVALVDHLGASADAGSMRRQAIASERARRWARARETGSGVRAIEATHQQIHEAFSDPCVTPWAVWRVLTGGMVAAIVLCTFAAVSIATDALEVSPRSARRGVGAPPRCSAWAFFLAGLGLVIVETMRPRR